MIWIKMINYEIIHSSFMFCSALEVVNFFFCVSRALSTVQRRKREKYQQFGSRGGKQFFIHQLWVWRNCLNFDLMERAERLLEKLFLLAHQFRFLISLQLRHGRVVGKVLSVAWKCNFSTLSPQVERRFACTRIRFHNFRCANKGEND